MTSSSSSSRRRRLRRNSEIDPPLKRQNIITEKEIAEYISQKRVRKIALKIAKKLKSEFRHSLFVWRKKIRRDVTRNGVVPLLLDGEYYAVKRLRERMAVMEKLEKLWEERALQKAQRREEMARSRARAQFDEWEKKEREFDFDQNKIRSKLAQLRVNEQSSSDQHDEEEEDEDGLIRPKYVTRVHNGFDWNKYNRIHYDHENPPPKTVQGYKFDIFYPDLVVDRSKSPAPTYTVEKDVNDSSETCIIRFHAGPPYADVAFRIASGEWDRSSRNGFKSTFDNGVLRLHFNFKRFRYRR